MVKTVERLSQKTGRSDTAELPCFGCNFYTPLSESGAEKAGNPCRLFSNSGTVPCFADQIIVAIPKTPDDLISLISQAVKVYPDISLTSVESFAPQRPDDIEKAIQILCLTDKYMVLPSTALGINALFTLTERGWRTTGDEQKLTASNSLPQPVRP